MAQDLYATLGVSRTASSDEIKRAFRKLAAKLHPDKNPGDKNAEARFKEVSHAYDILGDPKKRALYDEFGEAALREGFDAEQARQYKRWAEQAARGGQRTGYGGAGIPFDIEDLFGGRGGVGGVGSVIEDLLGGRFGRRRGPMRGRDLESEITIDFAAAVRGTTLSLQPQGSSEPVTVRIPAGADEGSRVRIRGHGGKAPEGGTPGDLILNIHVRPHPFFRREGDDLHVDVPITIAEAYKGARIRVPTPDKDVVLKVPEKTQSGQIVRLRGKGVARKNRTPGDLYVHFQVQVPTADTSEVREAIETLEKAQREDPREKLHF